MKLLVVLRRLFVVAALTLGLTATGATAAGADGYRQPSVYGIAGCDAAAAQWAITWQVVNNADVDGTIGNVRVYPGQYPIVGLPSHLPANGTVTGVQRIPANQYYAELYFDVNWPDGTVTYNVYGRTAIRITCRA